MKNAEQVVTLQPAISFSISFQNHFNRAGGRTSNVRQKHPMKLSPVAILLALSVQACERKAALNEASIRSWASSSEVVSRDRPSLYTDNGTRGSYLAVAAGDFKETPDGIDLESMTPLKEGFYVFPGKIRVRTIEEAIRTMKKIEPGRFNPKAEQVMDVNRP